MTEGGARRSRHKQREFLRFEVIRVSVDIDLNKYLYMYLYMYLFICVLDIIWCIHIFYSSIDVGNRYKKKIYINLHMYIERDLKWSGWVDVLIDVYSIIIVYVWYIHIYTCVQ